MKQGPGGLVLTLYLGRLIRIGRGRRITLVRTGVDAIGPYARICIAAPRSDAITRDDFTEEQHELFQRQREGTG